MVLQHIDGIALGKASDPGSYYRPSGIAQGCEYARCYGTYTLLHLKYVQSWDRARWQLVALMGVNVCSAIAHKWHGICKRLGEGIMPEDIWRPSRRTIYVVL